MTTMYKHIKKIILASLLVLGTSSTAFAYTIAPNQTVSLDSNGATGFFLSIQGGGDTYRAFFATDGTAQTGSLNAGKLDTLTFNSTLTSILLEKEVNGVLVATTGSLTGNFNYSLANVNFSAPANTVAAIKNVASGSGNVSFSGNIAGNTLQLSGAISPSFMEFTLGGFSGIYDAPINAFGNAGKLNFGLDIDGNNNVIHSWLHGNTFATFNGVSTAFAYGGDVHSAIGGNAAVPEPATMGLILSGLVGVASRKRKLAKV